jgi:hypothetical protein
VKRITVVETAEFIRAARAIFADDDRAAVIDFIATNPTAGAVMRGTGGVRKLRWAAGGKGKSGGARVIYYFHAGDMPVFLLTAFGKPEKANLTKAERNAARNLVAMLVSSYRK